MKKTPVLKKTKLGYGVLKKPNILRQNIIRKNLIITKIAKGGALGFLKMQFDAEYQKD